MRSPLAYLALFALVSTPLSPPRAAAPGAGGPFTLGGGPGGSGSGSGGGSSGSESSSGSGGSSSGSFLSSDASAPSSGLSPDSGCAATLPPPRATRAPVYMLFVVDGSGSMGQQNKWTAVTSALGSIFSSMENDPSIGVGLIVFADSMDQTLNTGPGPYPGARDRRPDRLRDHGAGRGAPSAHLGHADVEHADVLTPCRWGYGELGSFTPAAPLDPGGSKVLVLITDGVPTDHYCSTAHAGTNYPTNPCVTMAAQEHARETARPHVRRRRRPVPVVERPGLRPGVAPAISPLAGGGAQPEMQPERDPDRHRPLLLRGRPHPGSASAAALQTSFTNALEAIQGEVLDVHLPLQSTSLGALNPGLVNVTVNGAGRPFRRAPRTAGRTTTRRTLPRSSSTARRVRH